VSENREQTAGSIQNALRYERTLNEGHAFSRAVNGGVDEGFSPWVRFLFLEGYGLKSLRENRKGSAGSHTL
jgi:hypothetical protein